MLWLDPDFGFRFISKSFLCRSTRCDRDWNWNCDHNKYPCRFCNSCKACCYKAGRKTQRKICDAEYKCFGSSCCSICVRAWCKPLDCKPGSYAWAPLKSRIFITEIHSSSASNLAIALSITLHQSNAHRLGGDQRVLELLVTSGVEILAHLREKFVDIFDGIRWELFCHKYDFWRHFFNGGITKSTAFVCNHDVF